MHSRILFLAVLSLGCFTASALAADYTLTVHDYPAGDGPANLMNAGIPLKPGEISSASNLQILDNTTEVPIAARVLARWPVDNSIRSLQIQFEAPFTGASKSFTLRTGALRQTSDRALQSVTWRFPRKIATLPAAALCSSLVVWEQKPLGQSGFPAWDQKQRNSFAQINTEPNPATVCARTDQYYDSISTSYQIYVRTGELPYLTNGRRWAVHHRDHQIYQSGTNIGHGICTGGYVNNTRYTFVDGLVRDYLLWGDDESLRVAGLVVDNFYMPHAAGNYYKAPTTRGFWTEREAAFAQLGLIAYYEATGNTAYLDRARTRVHSLRQMQADNSNRAWVHNLYDHDPSEGCPESEYGSSPFMSGLLFESLIRYHKLTGDPLARESILWAVDDLRARTVSGDGTGFIYLGCPSVYSDPNPDIDNMITHAFGYAYPLTQFQNQQYLDFGRTVFNASVSDGYAGAPKQYNQSFRSSGSFVAYIDPSVPGMPLSGGADTLPPAAPTGLQIF